MLDRKQIEALVASALEKESPRSVLMVVPDHTRMYSNAGLIGNIAYHWCASRGIPVLFLEALGTHVPMTPDEISSMYGDIPQDLFVPHNWRTDVKKIGEVPASFVEEVSEGLWKEKVDVEVNRLVLDRARFDLVVSVGQVVPHEVVGMANHSKNLFVGAGGRQMINQSHIIGAVYGMERMMGRDRTPVRRIFDYAADHFLGDVNLLYMLTVTDAPGGAIRTHGLFAGRGRKPFEDAVALARETNIDFVPSGIRKCVVYLQPDEFHSTWLGNKAIYRTRMAIADGGELVVLAPGVERFGEDKEADRLIRKYGYRGRLHTLELLNANQDLKDNMGVAAHLIHGSSDGRFSITYAVRNISRAEIEGVGFRGASYDEMARRYDPEKLRLGPNMVDGEEVFFIPNPALGLWIDRQRFQG